MVLGAGISGLAAARALIERGTEPLVLESCPSPGGLTRTIRIGEFCFDYTGHLLHLARWGSPAGVPFAGLKDEDWQRIERRSCCWAGGKLITAPIQYHLGELPQAMRDEYVAAYEARPGMPGNATFGDYLTSGFGRGLADGFLIPLNEKTMASPVDWLTADAARRFFPAPDDAKVRAGLKADALAPREYNSQFWYPKVGGIERLAEGLGRGVNVRLLSAVERIDLGQRVVQTRDGGRWQWDKIYSSLPLPWLCRMSGDRELAELAAGLTHSATICINLGLRGELREEFRGVHWIYVADRQIPFYRVGFYSNISEGMCSKGRSSMYVEVGRQTHAGGETAPHPALSPEYRGEGNDLHQTAEDAVASLVQLGWVSREAIVCSAVHVMSCAYVHHTPARQQALGRIIDKLQAHGIHPIGRYGLWDHMSMEDSIASALDAVSRK